MRRAYRSPLRNAMVYVNEALVYVNHRPQIPPLPLGVAFESENHNP